MTKPSDPRSVPSSAAAGCGVRMSLGELFVTHPNLVRGLSVVVFLFVWKFFGRRMDPIFMTYPVAIFDAAVGLVQSGELFRGLLQSLIPFTIGMLISIILGIALG